MAASPILSIVAIILHAGSILLLFFILLAQARDSSPLNKFYWLQADTSGISGAPSTTRWGFYNYCGVSGSSLTHCSKNKADYPFDPVRNFGTTDGVPKDFVDRPHFYYYLTRFSFPFFLIGLFFDVVSFFTAIIGIPSRLITRISGLTSFFAFIFTAVAASLATVAFYKGKKAFEDDGSSAKLGVKLFAFAWTSVFILILTTFSSCFGLCFGRRNSDPAYASDSGYYNSSATAEGGRFGFAGTSMRRSARGNEEKEVAPETTSKKRGFFHVKRKQDEYADPEATPVEDTGDASSFTRA